MAQKQSVAGAIQDVRTSLQYSAQYLRELDEEVSEQAARKLDRLRWALRQYTTEPEKD